MRALNPLSSSLVDEATSPLRHIISVTQAAKLGTSNAEALAKRINSMRSLQRFMATNAPGSVILIRIAVGGIFLSEGIQKFLFPNDLAVGRFVKIGIPAPEIMGPFVGAQLKSSAVHSSFWV